MYTLAQLFGFANKQLQMLRRNPVRQDTRLLLKVFHNENRSVVFPALPRDVLSGKRFNLRRHLFFNCFGQGGRIRYQNGLRRYVMFGL